MENLYRTIRNLERQGKFKAMREALEQHYPMPQNKDADTFYCAGITLGRLGKAEGLQGAQTLARHLLSKACDLYNIQERRADCLSRIGICLWRDREFIKAESYVRNSLSLIRNTASEQWIVSNINLSIVLCEQGRFTEASEACAVATDATKHTDDFYLKGLIRMESGTVARYTESYPVAISLNAAAARMFQLVPNPYMLSIANNNLADLFRITGDLPKAIQHIGDAHKLASELNDAGLLNLICGTYGELCAALTEAKQ